MATATITSKGQITIPSAIRADLHVASGDRIEFVRIAEGRYEIVAATQDVRHLRGVIEATRVIDVDEMNDTIRTRAGKA